jgi:hypothetical protein
MVRRNVVAPLAGARLPVFELCQVYPIIVGRNVVAPLAGARLPRKGEEFA